MKPSIQFIKLRLGDAKVREEKMIAGLESRGAKTGQNLIDYELGRKDGILEALMIVNGEIGAKNDN